MKTLVLVRHAKSDWGYDFLKDIDRSLNERGYRDAYYQSKWYAEHNEQAQLIVSSPAIRAISTALIFARQLKYDEQKISIQHGIYAATMDEFLNTIHKLSDDIDYAMFFGHNPTITNVCNFLSTDFYIDNIPTCGIVRLEFTTASWQAIGSTKATKTDYKFVKV